MKIKRKAYVHPNLTCYAMELQQMIAETGIIKPDLGTDPEGGGLEDLEDPGAPEAATVVRKYNIKGERISSPKNTLNNIELKWFSDGLE